MWEKGLVTTKDPRSSLKLSKEKFKEITKSRVIDYWELKLRSDASSKPSLKFFNPLNSNLTKPHPILTTPESNPYEVNKSVIQLRMAPGRYPDDWLQRYWSVKNKFGQCRLCSAERGDLEHYLTSCLSLRNKREYLFHWWLCSSSDSPYLYKLFQDKMRSECQIFVKFVIDASSDPDVILLVQQQLTDLKAIFHLTHTFCYSIHKIRLKLLGQ